MRIVILEESQRPAPLRVGSAGTGYSEQKVISRKRPVADLDEVRFVVVPCLARTSLPAWRHRWDTALLILPCA